MLTPHLPGASEAHARGRLTVAGFLALLLGLLTAAALGALLLAVQAGRAALVEVGETARRARADEVAAAVERDFAAAPAAVAEVEAAIAGALVADGTDGNDPEAWRRVLTLVLLTHPNLVEVTLTRAELRGYDDRGQAELAPAGRWQLAVFREEGSEASRDARGQVTESVGAQIRSRLLRPALPDGPDDPTHHDTFAAAAHREARGQLLWSDLAYSELDRGRPEPQRRKTLTAQKALFSRERSGARFLGVLRTGLTSETLTNLGRTSAVASDGPPAPAPAGGDLEGGPSHLVFITDTRGRLVTRLAPDEPYVTMDGDGRDDEEGDLRVRAAHPPAAVRAALEEARAQGAGSTRVTLAGEPWLITLRDLAADQPQPWLVGVVVPERAYVGPLMATRNRLLSLFGGLALVLAIAAWTGTRTVGRALGALVQSTEAMQRFVFLPLPPARTRFREIARVLESLERAKTALRAMVKYVPVALVRQLYERGQEPTLGAEIACVTLMFTDIADFTHHAEALPPSLLAQALGRYFDAATRAVESRHGTVDKYIGDALMVLWNAPTPLPGHAKVACQAALATDAATRALASSSWWCEQGLPPWRTRIGLHTGDVLVGHFGAPERLNYTAMGDGVNLAARLEGLNKVYGTTILVSGDVRSRAGEEFLFRLVDRVAVKGKSQAVEIYELMASLEVGAAGLGLADTSAAAAQLASRRELAARYERALAAALRRDFAEALELLRPLVDDGPAQVLAARCERWLAEPPAIDWDGTWVATSK